MTGSRFWTETDRQITRLALPALGALVAEPLYVLADTAVVGHLGTPQLGGLALAGQALLTFHAVLIFLAYGTTAAVSRLLGADNQQEAARQAVHSIWLAVIAGTVGAMLLYVLTEPILELMGGRGATMDNARTYLRVSLPGLPAMAMSLACVGYLRGLQDTVRPLIVAAVTAAGNLVLELVLIYGFDQGIGASAFATVVAQWAGAGMYLWWVGPAIRAQKVALGLDLRALRRQMVVARNLFVRTAALTASFSVAVAAAARVGEPDLAAHEIAFQFWFLLALSLDAIAIAGQAMMGQFLGAGDVNGARRIGDRMVQWGIATGVLAGCLILAARPWLPAVFSGDDAVVALSSFLLIHLALMGPLAGLTFTLDGILIGAGDLGFLAWAMLGAATAFIPLALLVPALDLGIGWVWGAIWVLMLARGGALWWRFRSGRWLITGASV